MTASPEDSMKREQGLLPVIDGKGSIMNNEVLKQMTDVYRETAKDMKNLFRIVEIDTSSKINKDQQKQTAEKVATTVLEWIEEHIEEKILSLPKHKILSVFNGRVTVSNEKATNIIEMFHKTGTFEPRNSIESDRERVQALPICIIRNASGHVLRLRRKERKEDNPLHEKLVIWAGGHVRQEDLALGSAIPQCLVRELEEELRLRVDTDSMKLLGAIYLNVDVSSSKHVAIVYEWRAETDDVAIALSNAEFFERRGTSLSGKFFPVEDLISEIENKKLTEPWSDYIVREFIAKNDMRLSPRLLQ